MSFSKKDSDDLSGNQDVLLQVLWKRLKYNNWPITIADLPEDSALVGGAIRDGLLNRLNKKPDLDFVVRENAIELVTRLATKNQGNCVVLDEKRDIARLVVDGWTLDFASQEGISLEEDLLRRDFRCNAIALKLTSELTLIDPTGGIKDLSQKIIVAIKEGNLVEDPLRILRGFRLMSELNFALEDQTKIFFIRHMKLLNRVAIERVKGEILRIVNSKYADLVIPIIKEINLLGTWHSYEPLPIENICSKDLISFNVHELSIALPLVRILFLLSEEGLFDLSFSKRDIRRSRLMRKWLGKNDGLAFRSLSEDDRFQLHIELEKDLPALIMFLPINDKNIWLRRWRDPSDPLFHPNCPLDGFTLQQAFDVPSGPYLGELMQYLSKEKAFGRLSTKDQAFRLALNWTQQN